METNRESNLSRQLTFPLSGLTTGMQYEVFVRAHTSAGEGAPSPRVHVEVSARGKNGYAHTFVFHHVLFEVDVLI